MGADIQKTPTHPDFFLQHSKLYGPIHNPVDESLLLLLKNGSLEG